MQARPAASKEYVSEKTLPRLHWDILQMQRCHSDQPDMARLQVIDLQHYSPSELRQLCPVTRENASHWAVFARNSQLLALLIEKAIDCNLANFAFIRPIHIAASLDDIRCLGLILEAEAASCESDILLETMQNVFRLFSENFGSCNEENGAKEAGQGAAGLDDVIEQDLEALVSDFCADCLNARTKDGFTPLLSAVSANALRTASALLECAERLHVLPQVLSARTSPQLWQPVHFAADAGNLALLQQLRRRGASVDTASLCGRTPLMLASTRGHVAVVRSLLADGSGDVANRLAASDTKGWTAAHLACMQDRADVLGALLEAGAKPDARTSSGRTALMVAAKYGSVQCARLLTGRRCGTAGASGAGAASGAGSAGGETSDVPSDVTCTDHNGNTALHIAIHAHASTELLRVLVDAAPSLATPNAAGLTAMCLAQAVGNVLAVDLLDALQPLPLSGSQWHPRKWRRYSNRSCVRLADAVALDFVDSRRFSTAVGSYGAVADASRRTPHFAFNSAACIEEALI